MRIIAGAVVAFAVFAVGLVLRPALQATASVSPHAGATIDPYAMHLKIDHKSLPQPVYADLY